MQRWSNYPSTRRGCPKGIAIDFVYLKWEIKTHKKGKRTNLGKSEFDKMPPDAVKTHQGRSFRIALGRRKWEQVKTKKGKSISAFTF
jgi:hypothetical protein